MKLRNAEPGVGTSPASAAEGGTKGSGSSQRLFVASTGFIAVSHVCKIDSYIMTLNVDGRNEKMERGEMADSTSASAAQSSLVLKPNYLTDDPSRLQLLRKPSVTDCPCPPWLVRAVFRVLRALSTRSLSLGKLRSPAIFWHPLPHPLRDLRYSSLRLMQTLIEPRHRSHHIFN